MATLRQPVPLRFFDGIGLRLGAAARLVRRSDDAAANGRNARALDPVLGRLGSLEVRLATTAGEIRQAQRLRYEVFCDEMSAAPTGLSFVARRDIDRYDAICDHLLVLDHAIGSKPKVVATYRLLRQEVAERHFGFYAASEYDLAPLVAANPQLRFLELGRSCVLKAYRGRRTVELLWHGIWRYVLHHRVDVMFGCGSLKGTDPGALATPLSFLHHFARAPDPWRVRARTARYLAMDLLPKEAVDPRAAMRNLPPLIKGYLRLGATFGDGAVVDRQFRTTDVFVVLPVSAISDRYIDHFGPSAERHAA